MIKYVLYAVRIVALIASGLATLSIVTLVVLAAAPAAASSEPSAERQAELAHLLIQDCGSCHGLTLAGGLGPPLQAQALSDKPAEYLTATILYGRPGTAMPPWRPFLTDREAAWLARLLKRQTP